MTERQYNYTSRWKETDCADLCLLEWTDMSYLGRTASGENIEVNFKMNLKGSDRDQYRQTHRDKKMQDIEVTGWLIATLKSTY